MVLKFGISRSSVTGENDDDKEEKAICCHPATTLGVLLTSGFHLMTQLVNGVKDATWDKTASQTTR